MKEVQFDYIFSVGPACRPAKYLSIFNLRKQSAPLDWQMSYSLDTVLKLFNNRFNNFFENIEEDLTYTGKHRKVKDLTNDIISIHNYSWDVSLDEQKQLVFDLMQKRFSTMDNNIKNSKKVCIICNRSDSIEKLKNFLESFSNVYPKQCITLLNIRNSDIENQYEVSLNEKLKIIEVSFCDINEFDTIIANNERSWLGSEQKWEAIIQNITLSDFEPIKLPEKVGNKKIIIVGENEYIARTIYYLSHSGYGINDVFSLKDHIFKKIICGYKVKKFQINDSLKDEYVVIISEKDNMLLKRNKELLESNGYPLVYLAQQIGIPDTGFTMN